jgi:hypothetical protein
MSTDHDHFPIVQYKYSGCRAVRVLIADEAACSPDEWGIATIRVPGLIFQ